MQIVGGDDISNDIITLGAYYYEFFNVCIHSRSFPLRAGWRKSDSSVDGEPQGNWRQNSNSRDVVASSPSFSRPAARALRGASLLQFVILSNITIKHRKHRDRFPGSVVTISKCRNIFSESNSIRIFLSCLTVFFIFVLFCFFPILCFCKL